MDLEHIRLMIAENGDTIMSELLHKNSKGITIFREDYKKRSQVKVFSEFQGKRHILRSYRFKQIPDRFNSPFCSWDNLDCCGGWSSDDTYLDTAVQEGKKLYAGRYQRLKSSYFPSLPSRDEALRKFQKIVDALPDGVTAGIEGRYDREDFLHTFICREGKIADYFDLKDVFKFYGKLGLNFPQNVVAQVESLCSIEIKTFGGEAPPFLYYQAGTPVELITTGLLLGYPIESTASILCGY